MNNEMKFSRQVSPEELEISMEGPAIVTNKFFIATNQTFFRIAFAEQYGETTRPEFRAAIVMTIEDTLQLYSVLGDVLAKLQGNLGKGN